MATLVNGVATAPDVRGITQGSSTEGSRIAGDGGNNNLQGNHGNDTFYGGAGNDTFRIKASCLAAADATTNNIPATDVIYDFGGAGGWSATNNDFLALSGFGAGSTLTFNHNGGNDPHLQFYTIHDTATNADYSIFIKSINGNHLGAGDYAFYSPVLGAVIV